MNLDEVLAKLEQVKRSGAGWIACCPAHEDSSPSLSIKEGDDGKLLVHCQAGCSWQEVFKALGMNEKRPRWDADKAEAIYDYANEHGELLYQVLRMPGKEFPARHMTEDGWAWNLDGVNRVPYKLPSLVAAVKEGRSVVIAEGEKDVETLLREGQAATCNPGGAGNWRPEYARFFKDAVVILWPDNDEPGLAHARRIKKNLLPVAKEIHVVQAKAGKDASDHFAAGLTLADVEPIELSEEDEVRLSDVNAREVQWHWKPFVQVGAFHMLFGDGGIGKGTWLAHLIAAITRGTTDASNGPENVLVISSEDSEEVDLKPRVLAAGGDTSRVVVLQRHILLPRDLDYLAEKIELERQGAKTGAVIIDPVANHIGNASSDVETSVRAAINELNFIAERTNCLVIGVRHITKADRSMLGSVAWKNTPRVVLSLDHLSEGSATRVLEVMKSNRGRKGARRYYRLEEAQIPGLAGAVPVIVPDSYSYSIPAPEEEKANDDWLASAR